MGSMEERMAVAERDIGALQEGENRVWDMMDKIRETLSNIQTKIAGTVAVVGILQTLALGFLIWKLTSDK